ncbi:hypothetical protein AOLI_G00210940 [Acnodon oligacanthus]
MTVRLSSNLVYYSQGRESYFAKSLLSAVSNGTAGRNTRAGMGANTAAKCWGERSNGEWKGTWRRRKMPDSTETEMKTAQSWGVHSQQAFLLYCLALGPTDLSIHWHSNGRRLDTVNEYRHTLSHDAVLVSSWVREQPLSKDAHYQCVAVSKSGNDTSKIDLRLSSRDEANTFSEELNQWREALADHERQLQNWKKAWESCDGQGVL